MTAAAQARFRVRLPLIFISAACWGILFARSQGAECGPMLHQHAGTTIAMFSADWLLMLGAMMAPGLVMSVLHIRTRSLSALRIPLLVSFAVAYLFIWLLAGLLCMVLRLPLGHLGERLAIVIVTAAAVLWQCAPIKQRCLNRCHAAPTLAPFGMPAVLSSFYFGCTHGSWCAGSCGLLMLLTTTLQPPAHGIGMVLTTLWITGERLENPSAPRWAWRVPIKALKVAAFHGRSLLARMAILRAKPQSPFYELTAG
jgi:predicted metal-binding membrane protein